MSRPTFVALSLFVLVACGSSETPSSIGPDACPVPDPRNGCRDDAGSAGAGDDGGTAGVGAGGTAGVGAGGTAGVGGAGAGGAGTGGGGGSTVDGGLDPDGGGCTVTVQEHPIEGAGHLPLCSPTSYGTNPPSSGNHYGTWAQYQTYAKPIPRGFWVHSLEHGAIVITYHCDGSCGAEGCAGELAQIQALIDSLPEDCGSAPKRRIILAPDPELDVRFAASAWGHTLRASCFEPQAFRDFIAAHYAKAPEDICADGQDPTGGPCGESMCP